MPSRAMSSGKGLILFMLLLAAVSLGMPASASAQPIPVTISSDAPDPVAAPFTVQAQFGEKVTGFAAEDIATTNATVSNLKSFACSPIAVGNLDLFALGTDGSIHFLYGGGAFGMMLVPEGNNFSAISVRENHGLALRVDGTLASWGSNLYDGGYTVPAGNDFVAIATGINHSLALRANGSLIAWDINSGASSTVPAGNDFVAIAAGAYSVALRADGSLVTSPDNGDTPAGNDFVAIAAGSGFNLALRVDGSLVTWGGASQGMPTGNNFKAISAGEGFGLALRTDGSIAAWGDNSYGQLNAPAGNDFVAITAGSKFGLALRADGSMAAWQDDFGYMTEALTGVVAQLPVSLFTFTATPVGSGEVAVAVPEGVAQSADLRSNAASNQLTRAYNGAGSLQVTITPAEAVTAGAQWRRVGTETWLDSGATESGLAPADYDVQFKDVAGWDTPANQTVTVSDGLTATAEGVYVRQTGTLLVTLEPAGAVTDGAQWSADGGATWKATGESLTLPVGSATVQYQAVPYYATPANATVTIQKDQETAVTGTYTATGNLQVTITPSEVVAAGAKWRRVGTTPWLDSGATENALVVGDYEVEFSAVTGWTKPANFTATVVAGQTSAQAAAYTTTPITVTLTSDAATSVSAPFTVQALFGEGVSGFAVEDIATSNATISNFKSFSGSSPTIAGGDSHSLVIKSDGSLAAWGLNTNGQCTVPAGTNYVAVAAGDFHSLALKSDGSLAAWGKNNYSQCTVPAGNNFVAVTAGEGYSLALRSDGSLVAWGKNDLGQCTVPAGNNFIAVAGGGSHSIAMRADGSLAGWGYNWTGQATVPTGNNYMAIAAGALHSLAVRTDGSLAAWGYNNYGQTNVPAGNNFVAVDGGTYHGVALRADGSLVGWGYNADGQSSVPAGNNFISVASGAWHHLALRADGTVAGWGYNNAGQRTIPGGLVVHQPLNVYTLYSFTVTPTSPGEVGVMVPAGVAQGAHFRPNTASNRLTRTYYGVGSLQVSITPAEAVTAGAQWRRVGTTTWMNSGATETGVLATEWPVEFKVLTGWDTPANQTLTVSDGQMATAEGVYVRQTGTLLVTIEPADAVTAGAQWSADGGTTWKASGESLTLPTGSYAVQYKSVTDWSAPANATAVIQKDQETAISGTYVQPGSLQVTITPAEAISGGALWRRVGTTPWLASGATESGLAPADYTVEFNTITGWTKPVNLTATVAEGQTTAQTAVYTPIPIPVTLSHDASIFTPAAPLNTNAATDTVADRDCVLKTDGAGTWIAVWSAPSGRTLTSAGDDPNNATKGWNDDLYFARSTNNGLSWSAPAPLKTNYATDDGDDYDVDMATDGQGKWTVVWRSLDSLGNTIGNDSDMMVTCSSDNGVTWSAPTALNTDATSDSGYYSSVYREATDFSSHITTDGQGHWVAVWSRVDNRTSQWQSSVLVAVSNDNGAHWSAPVSLKTLSGYATANSTVCTNNTGRWIAAWCFPQTVGLDNDIYFAISDNNGASWTSATTLNTNAASDSGQDDTPSLVADASGNWVCSWNSTDSLGGTIGTDQDILVSRSSNNGATWSAPAALNINATRDISDDMCPKMVTNGQGIWVTVWMTKLWGGDWDIAYSLSGDLGSTWSTPEPVNTNAAADSSVDSGSALSLSLATDKHGRWIAAWASNYPLGDTGSDYDILFARANITSPSTAPIVTGPFTVQAIFGQKVTGLDAAEITATNGTVSNLKTFSCPTFSAGNNHNLAIKPDGSLAAWGLNTSGQCTVPAGTDFVSVDAGGDFSLAMRADGSLAAWGINDYGQCTVPTGNDFVAIAAGGWHGVALRADGSLAVWGRNDFGQCDNVPTGNNFVTIGAGRVHSIALRSDGTLAAWGHNDSYNQSVAPVGNNYVAIAGGWDHNLALRADGSLAAWGYNAYGQTTVPSGTNYAAISAGGYHSLALRTDGTLAAWGYNGHGELTVPSGSNFAALAGGFYYSLALRTDGTVAAWGSNANGQCTVPGGLVIRPSNITICSFTVTPTALGQVSVSLPAGVALGGNYQPNAASNTLTRTYSAGSLTANITPAEAVAAGAQWRRVGTSNWMNSGDIETGVMATEWAIEFKELAGWEKPAIQAVTVVDGQTALVEAAYVYNSGTLRVTLAPAEAVAAGAQWSVDGGTTWKASGESLTLPSGSYTVQYKATAGWIAPADAAATIQTSQETALSGTYLQPGSLQVTITPADAVTAGAKWRRVGTTPWLVSGVTEDALAPADYTVEFNTVTGWTKPANLTATIVASQTTAQTASYTAIPIAVTLSSNPSSIFTPAGALNTDAQSDVPAWGDDQPTLATDGSGVWVAVWVKSGSNTLATGGDDGYTGSNGKNEDLLFARSMNNGQTWSAPAKLKTNYTTDNGDDVEPNITTDCNGHWMVVWRSHDTLNGTIGNDANILTIHSADNGVTWGAVKAVNTDGAGDVSPKITTDGLDHWVTVWSTFDNRSGSWQTTMKAASSSDYGATWSAPVTLQGPLSLGTAASGTPSVTTDGKGRWIAAWGLPLSSSGDYDIYFAISDNNGASWTSAAALNTNAATDSGLDFIPALATDGNGNWVCTWTSTDSLGGTIGTDQDILVSRSSNNGSTWSFPSPLNTTAAGDTVDDRYPALATNGQGIWVASWMTTLWGWRFGHRLCHFG